MTDIGLCEERRDAAFGQEAGFKSGTRPTGKQAYLNKARLVTSGLTPFASLRGRWRILFEHDDLTYD